MDFGAEQVVQEKITVHVGRGFSAEHYMTVQSHPGCCSRRLPAVVGLDCPGSEDNVGTLRQRVGNQKLELARLVAAVGQAGLIVSLD
jgi:hypothetical protein